MKTPEPMKAAKGEFCIRISEKTGNILGVFDSKGKWQAGKMSWKPGTIQKVKGDIALMEVHSSPGHWCVIGGQRRWCPW